jgi:hypothetical protein
MIRRYITSETLVYLSIVLIAVLVVVGVIYLDKQSTPRVDQAMDVEYHLEIINQDSVVIRNIDSGRTYKAHIDSIQSVLLDDNL